jgi:hypothetical protein
MPQSYSDVVRDALQLINVIGEIDTPSAEQGAHGLRVLNDMMAHWEEDGLDVEYSPGDDLTQPIDVDQSALRAIKANLAVDLAAYYRVPVSPEIAIMAQSSYDALYRNRFTIPELDMSHLHSGDANWTDWDINDP